MPVVLQTVEPAHTFTLGSPGHVVGREGPGVVPRTEVQVPPVLPDTPPVGLRPARVVPLGPGHEEWTGSGRTWTVTGGTPRTVGLEVPEEESTAGGGSSTPWTGSNTTSYLTRPVSGFESAFSTGKGRGTTSRTSRCSHRGYPPRGLGKRDSIPSGSYHTPTPDLRPEP